jgi:hypothetical protein
VSLAVVVFVVAVVIVVVEGLEVCASQSGALVLVAWQELVCLEHLHVVVRKCA